MSSYPDGYYLYADLDGLPLPAFGVHHSLSVIGPVINHRLGVFGLLLQRETYPAYAHGAGKAQRKTSV